MVGFQGLVNGWIKVNAKHALVPRDEHGQEIVADRNHQVGTTRHVATGKDGAPQNGGSGTIKTASTGRMTAVSSSSEEHDVEATAVKRFHGRKNKRRLQRTVSQTDLLREMAREREKEEKHQALSEKSSSKESLHEEVLQGGDAVRQQQAQHVVTTADEVDHSLPRVASFFGAGIPDGRQQQQFVQQQQQQQRPINTGKYLNEAAFVQQLENSKASGTALSTFAEAPPPALQPPPRHVDSSSLPSGSSHTPHSSESIKRSGTPRQERPASVNPMQQLFGGAFRQEKQPCENCAGLESRLLCATADLEYLRSVTLRNEYTCRQCEAASLDSSSATTSKQKQSTRGTLTARYESQSLNDASKRLVEVTARHKRQIEQVTKERSRWQQDMHFKLSKFAMMCKDLNEESAMRKQEALKLQQELQEVKAERDALAAKVMGIQREMSSHEGEKEEHELLRAMLEKYVREGLQKANEAIEQRDKVILDLSARLEQALETVEREREQQRHRRQIIFPARPSDTSVEDKSSNKYSTNEEVRQTDDAAAKAQALLEATRQEAVRREAALLLRCQQLEKQLEQQKQQQQKYK